MSTSRAYISPYNMRCAVRCAERRALSACVPGNARPHAPHAYSGDDGSHVRPLQAQKSSHILPPWKKYDHLRQMVHAECGTVLQFNAAPRDTVRLLTAAPEDTRH